MPISLENIPADEITPMQIRDLVDNSVSEGNRLEFKREPIAVSEIRKTLAAMANSEGGHLIIGIAEDGEDRDEDIVDVPESGSEVQRVRDAALDGIEPRLQGVSVHAIVIDTKTVVVCHIPESSRKPHAVTFKDEGRRYYSRYQRTNRPMTDDEIRQLYHGDSALRAIGELRLQVEALAKQNHDAQARSAIDAELKQEVDEPGLLTLREPKAFIPQAERIFRESTGDTPYVRITATPIPLGQIDLLDKQQELTELFSRPPRYRAHGFDMDLGLADEGVRRSKTGFARPNTEWKHLRVLRNGHSEFWTRADGAWASWGEPERGQTASRPFSPLVLIESTACFVRFAKAICELAEHQGTVLFQLGMYNIEGRLLLPYPIGTHGHYDGGLARLGDETIGVFQDQNYASDIVEENATALPGTVPFRLIQHLYHSLGYSREHIPYFDDDSNEFAIE